MADEDAAAPAFWVGLKNIGACVPCGAPGFIMVGPFCMGGAPLAGGGGAPFLGGGAPGFITVEPFCMGGAPLAGGGGAPICGC